VEIGTSGRLECHPPNVTEEGRGGGLIKLQSTKGERSLLILEREEGLFNGEIGKEPKEPAVSITITSNLITSF